MNIKLYNRLLRAGYGTLIVVTGLLSGEHLFAAETHKSRVAMCEKKLGKIPSFKCEDGYELAKTIDGAGHCPKPENLYARCVYQSTLGKLKIEGQPDVEAYFSCRKKPDGKNNFKNDKSGKYYDIAIIQHNPKTGDTCFYQRLSDYDGNKDIPAPAKDDGTFWNKKPNFCVPCHTNGPFIRTPHYQKVLDSTNTVVKSLPAGAKAKDYLTVRNGFIKLLSSPPSSDTSKNMQIGNGYVKALNILPDVYRRKAGKYRYNVLHEQAKAWDVSKKDNVCMQCHSIGAHQTKADINKAMKMSKMNLLAVGKIMSLREKRTSSCYSKLTSDGKCPSPTTNGYHDFMNFGFVTSDQLKAGLDDLAQCFQEKSKRPKECVIRDPSKPLP